MAADGRITIDTKIDTRGIIDGSRDIEGIIERLINSIDKLSENIQNIISSAGDSAKTVAENSQVMASEIDGIANSAQVAEQSLLSLNEQMSEIPITGLAQAELPEFEEQPNIAMVNESTYGYDQSVIDYINQYATAAESASEENANLSESEAAVAQSMHEVGGYIGALQASLNGLRTVVTRTIPLLGKGLFTGLIFSLKALAKAAKKAALEMAQLAGRGIVGGLKKITAGIFGLNKAANKSSSGFGASLKTLIKYGLGIRSLYALVNKLRTALVNGFKNLAQYSNDTNATLSGLMSSLEQCKNALATAFDPILQAIAPALNYMIGLVTAAATAVAQLIAVLTGKGTFIKAAKVQKDYAQSLKGTGSAAKKAGKDAEGALAPFDKLNVMAEESASGGGGGGGAGDISPSDMFETVEVDSSFKKLGDLFKSKDWKGIGEYVAGQLNEGLRKIYDVINWDNVGPKVTYFANAFTESFNSLVNNLDWNLLGATIGTGINTITNTLNLLIEGIDWQNLGGKISTGIMGIVNEVNWENLGRLFGNKFMILWNTLYGLVVNLDYGKIGVALGNGLNGMTNAIDLGTVGAVLGKALTGLFEIAINFANTFNWNSLGDNISNGINNFFQEFDGEKFAQAATKIISGILDTLIEVISTTDWSAIWKDIIDFLVNVNWIELIGKLVIAAGMLIAGLLKGLVQAIAETDWGEVWDSILNAFKNFFGIHSPSTIMQEMGGHLIEGLVNGISNFIPNVIQKFSEIKDKIASKWNEIKENTLNKWSEIKDGLSRKWDDVKQNALASFGSIREGIANAWRTIKTNTQTLWGEGGISGVIKGCINGIISLAESMVNAVISAINGMINNLNKISIDIPDTPFSDAFTIGFDIPSLSEIHLPRLASGTVVPPRAGEFAAILGDNNRETEVVSPLSTMKQAMLEAMAQAGGVGGGDINLTVNLDGKVIYQDLIKRNRAEKKRTGANPLLV